MDVRPNAEVRLRYRLTSGPPQLSDIHHHRLPPGPPPVRHCCLSSRYSSRLSQTGTSADDLTMMNGPNQSSLRRGTNSAPTSETPMVLASNKPSNGPLPARMFSSPAAAVAPPSTTPPFTRSGDQDSLLSKPIYR
ncbi:hypothetical protein D9613_012545 [Agrocybe pediades]|uniref:Uncharacterized protein n=1 Tax=Agrocybe pediades TaxID=84607 RepID=A0A8H4VLZ7_9AGAR|nr:hypothetical protein D9613_012545 [Agrocybe pediades]